MLLDTSKEAVTISCGCHRQSVGYWGAGWGPCALTPRHTINPGCQREWAEGQPHAVGGERPGRDGRVRGRRPDFQCSPPPALLLGTSCVTPLGLSFLIFGEGPREAGLPFSVVDIQQL